MPCKWVSPLFFGWITQEYHIEKNTLTTTCSKTACIPFGPPGKIYMQSRTRSSTLSIRLSSRTESRLIYKVPWPKKFPKRLYVTQDVQTSLLLVHEIQMYPRRAETIITVQEYSTLPLDVRVLPRRTDNSPFTLLLSWIAWRLAWLAQLMTCWRLNWRLVVQLLDGLIAQLMTFIVG